MHYIMYIQNISEILIYIYMHIDLKNIYLFTSPMYIAAKYTVKLTQVHFPATSRSDAGAKCVSAFSDAQRGRCRLEVPSLWR